eukprot:Rhum_TRINITY_DN12074_c0_g2::Rhum_TRINITY_DN12074_c0_g2_i1::g.49021::m.49021
MTSPFARSPFWANDCAQSTGFPHGFPQHSTTPLRFSRVAAATASPPRPTLASRAWTCGNTFSLGDRTDSTPAAATAAASWLPPFGETSSTRKTTIPAQERPWSKPPRVVQPVSGGESRGGRHSAAGLARSGVWWTEALPSWRCGTLDLRTKVRAGRMCAEATMRAQQEEGPLLSQNNNNQRGML